MADHESISKTEDGQRPTPGVDLETNRVSSDYLSCEIPDGWEATYYGENYTSLFQMSPKGSGPRDDVWIDCEMGVDTSPYWENRRDTPESRLAITKSVYFSPHSIGCYSLTPLDYHTVEAHGCKCAIIQVATSNNVGLAFNIIAESPRNATLHATFGSWNNDRLDEARELVDRLAKSICVYESDTPSYVRDLQECLDSQVDPDHLFKVIARYSSVLENIKEETPNIARFVKQAYKADQRTEHERLIAAVEEYAESNKSVGPYLELLADVADAQARYLKEDSANLDKLRQIVAETSKGSIFFPNSLPRDFRKLPQQEWDEVKRTLAPSERMRAILSRIGVEWPDSDNVDDGNSDSDAVVPDIPTVMLTLLSDDYVFFQNNEISWSKGHHVIKGLQVNSPKQRDLATIAVENGFDDINDLLNYFIAFMSEVEKDEALVVPKASISKALHPIVRRGDLTGITLANLAASMAAFRVLNDRPNNYTVIYDGTLADGIPHFFDLMCRLLWDLRLCMTSLKGVPFRVTFARCRNLDLCQLLKGNVSRVEGAQNNPVSVTVSEEPAIGLEVTTTEETPVDEEDPSVELQKPDLTQLPRGNVSRVNGAQVNPGTVNVTKTPAVDLGEHTAQGAASSPTAKKGPAISEKRAGLEKVLDRLLTAATKYCEANEALWQYEEDERTLEEMPTEKKRLEKKIRSIQRKQQSISDELTANASRKHDLQEERKQLLSRADMLEEKAHGLEEERGGLGFFSILKKSQIDSVLKTIASRQDEIRTRTEQIDEELKSLARTRKKLLKDIKEPEGKIACEQAKLEALLQEEKETKDRLENAEKSRDALSTERSAAKGQRTKALKRYNGFISGQLFTLAEKKSDEYREVKELMASTLTKLKEQGVTPTNKATFPTLKA